MTSEAKSNDVVGFKLSPSTVEMIRSDVRTAAAYGRFDQETVKASEKAPAFVTIVMPDNKAIVGVEIERGDDETDPLSYETPAAGAKSESSRDFRVEISKFNDDCYWCFGSGAFRICILKPFCS